MITIEYTQTTKVILSMGTRICNHDAMGKVMEEMEKYKLLSSTHKEWIEFTGDYNLSSIEVIALSDTHMALKIIHQEDGTHNEVADIRFYRLKTK